MSEETPKDETQTDAVEAVEEEQTADDKVEATPEPAAEEPAAEEPAAEEAAAEEPAAAEPVAEEAAAEEPAAEEPAAEEPAAEPTAEEPAAEEPRHTYEELHAMNVTELREVAAKIEHDAVHGYTTMHKEHLMPAICAALGIEVHEHHKVVGIDKDGVKAKIRQLKKERDEAEAAGDKAGLKILRRRVRSLKRKIRKATV